MNTKALRTLKAPLIRGKNDNGTNSKVKKNIYQSGKKMSDEHRFVG